MAKKPKKLKLPMMTTRTADSRPAPGTKQKSGLEQPAAEVDRPPVSRAAERLNSQEVLCGRDLLAGKRPGLRGDSRKCLLLVETADPADRAHDVRVGSRAGAMLLPAHVMAPGPDGERIAVPNRTLPARPRQYPAHQLNSAGLAVDSQFDAWHERRLRLSAMTLASAPEAVPPLVLMRMRAMARYGVDGFRQRERPTTYTEADPDDRPDLHAAGSAILRAARVYRAEVHHGDTEGTEEVQKGGG